MGRGRRRAGALAAVAVTAALVAGCGADRDGGSTKDMSAAAPAQAAAGEAAKADSAVGAPGVAASAAPKAATGQGGTGQGATGQGAPAPAADARQIAYSAQLTVRTAKVDEAMARARALALAAGGYVASETASGRGEGGGEEAAGALQSGQITVKVPSAAFQQTLDGLAELGEVVSRRSQAEDLTQQVADVNSRMQSQQASVDRVRALMAQAKTLAEIVSLESELSRREADLESLQKQVKELSAKTSLSTVTLDVRRQQDKPAPDGVPEAPEKDGFWESVGSALSGGWHVLAVIVRGIVVAVAAVLPFLLVAVPVAAVLWAVRVRRRKAAGPALPAPGQDEEDEDGGPHAS
ncbi:DUF4349 domain-containing protein [Kitasatospora sp. NPDC057500]|uniref:DUF4349 domain-containing protein n=1 Tax=Kitasatospora sp. NPDC057500 TaxID=3346151 RepID=UPI0036C29802